MQWYAVPPSDRGTDGPAEPLRSHRRAMEHGDEVVQQLTIAKYALSVGDQARAMAAIDDALGIARHALAKLLDVVSPPESLTRAGALVRSGPAGAGDVPMPPKPRQPED